MWRSTIIVLVIWVVAWSIFANVASAALISADWNQSAGDGLLTRDTVSGLEWLDVTLTINQTYDQVRTGNWYQAGFSHATMAELQTLFLDAGIPDDGFDIALTFPTETRALAQLLGVTISTEDGRLSTYGFSGSDFFGNTVTTATHPIGSLFSALLGKIDYLPAAGDLPAIGEAHFSQDHPFSNEASLNYGSFLVRPAPVPLPGALSLMFSGLSLIAWRIRTRGKLMQITSRNTILSTLTVLSVLLFSNVELASGSTVTFEIGGVLTEASGTNGLAVGDPFTGTFSYSLEQTGTDVPSVQATRYVFDSYSLTLQGQTVFSTGGDVTIENNGSFGDNFTLNVDDTTPAALVTGSINGAVGFELFLFLRALNGAPFMDTSLPPSLNLADFPDMRRIDLAFQSNRGAVIGEISTLNAVPLPAAIWLFISGLGGLGLLWGRNKTGKTANA